MLLTWFGHSCFKIEAPEGSVVLDPYADGSVPGLAPLRLRADAVLCSHGHRDHGAAQNVTLTGRPCGLTVRVVDCFHDDKSGALRGDNRIHAVTGGGLTVVHLGDLGHMLTPEQAGGLMEPDALLIPVGGFFTIDAVAAEDVIELLRPRVVIPMHYRSGKIGYPVIAELDRFLPLRGDVTHYAENTFELRADTPAQTAVLTCPVK